MNTDELITSIDPAADAKQQQVIELVVSRLKTCDHQRLWDTYQVEAAKDMDVSIIVKENQKYQASLTMPSTAISPDVARGMLVYFHNRTLWFIYWEAETTEPCMQCHACRTKGRRFYRKPPGNPPPRYDNINEYMRSVDIDDRRPDPYELGPGDK